MSDHKPVAIAMIVGSLALAANGAAAFVALSVTTQPQAIGFGIAGLVASFIGLITTAVWARRRDVVVREVQQRAPMLTPWTPIEETEEEDEAFASAPLEEALLAAEEEAHLAYLAAGRSFDTVPAMEAATTSAGDNVVQLRDWVRTHRRSVPQRQLGNS